MNSRQPAQGKRPVGESEWQPRRWETATNAAIFLALWTILVFLATYMWIT